MNRFVSLLVCSCALIFASCESDLSGTDSGTSGTSGTGGSETSGTNVSFKRPDALIGDQPADDSYVRLVVQLKSVKEGGPVYNYANTINLNALSSVEIPEIAEGEYNVYAWADSFSSQKDSPSFYNVENLSNIFFGGDGYGSVASGAKTAYYVSQENVKIDGSRLDLDMRLPHGGYRILMTDLYSVLGDKGAGCKAVVTYAGFLPSGFNVYTQRVVDSVPGASYSMSLPEITARNTICVAEDIVLCGQNTSQVSVSVKILDKDGEVCWMSDQIMIPLENGKVNEQNILIQPKE